MTEWTWSFDPPDLAEGLPVGTVAEIERLATELAALGELADNAGNPKERAGGLRDFPFSDDKGYLHFLLSHQLKEIVIVRITYCG